MSWRLVDGVRLPDPVGGHPALDFCNTRAGWGAPTPKEYLTGGRALLLWVREAGLLHAVSIEDLLATTAPADGPADPTRDPTWGRALGRALRLRSALYAAVLDRAGERDWNLISTEAAAGRRVLVLGPGTADGEPARWRPRPRGTDPAWVPDLVLALIAAAAEELLTSPLVTVVAACPGAGCGWVFADPRRRRRWCSMAVCGNRAKARRHAQRHLPPR